jgi:hypothetical protein
MAVAYELRMFPQYGDIINRALKSTGERGAIQGEGAALLRKEFDLTIDELRKA